MKKIAFLLIAAIAFSAAATTTVNDTPIKGAWIVVKSRYGDEKELVNHDLEKVRAIKMFTGTRWSGSSYNLKEKKISGSNGGSYKISETK